MTAECPVWSLPEIPSIPIPTRITRAEPASAAEPDNGTRVCLERPWVLVLFRDTVTSVPYLSTVCVSVRSVLASRDPEREKRQATGVLARSVGIHTSARGGKAFFSSPIYIPRLGLGLAVSCCDSLALDSEVLTLPPVRRLFAPPCQSGEADCYCAHAQHAVHYRTSRPVGQWQMLAAVVRIPVG